jgi:hypothetical protein
MSTMAETREDRARRRRATWTLEPLSSTSPLAPQDFSQRMILHEQMRRLAFALQGVAYPEGSTPKEQRRLWPVTKIG